MNFTQLLTALYNLVAGLNPVLRSMLSTTFLVLAGFAYLEEMWGALFVKIDAMAAVTIGVSDFSPLGMMNYIAPMDTVCTMLTAYAALRLACAGVRIVKSFVPTIA